MPKVSVSGSRSERKAQINVACRVTVAKAHEQFELRNYPIKSRGISVGTRGSFSDGHPLGRG